MAPQDQPGPHGKPPAKGGGLGGWVKRNKGPALAIGGLGAVVLITIAKRGSSSSSSTGSGTTTGTDTSQTGVQPGVYGYGSGDYSGGYDQYAAEMQQLQNFLNSTTAGSMAAGTAASATTAAGGSSSSTPVSGGSSSSGGSSGGSSSSGSTPRSSPQPVTGSSSKSGNPIITSARRLIPAQTITVPKGATLLSLSKQYLGTTNRTQLAHTNGLGTGAGLRTGQKLIVPAHY